jgi:hypothetical protein
MATAKDILLDNDDLIFANGDFSISDSDQQHIQDIVFENTGAYKQYPLVGVGIINYLNSSGAQLILTRNIKSQLETDGYRVDSVKFSENDVSNFTVDAVRS